MGRGDKKTKKGKMSMGSFGVSRKKRPSKAIAAPTASVEKAAPVAAAPKTKAKAKA